MKRFILAIALILSMALVSSAKANNENDYLIKSLTAALQNAKTTYNHNANSFSITSFEFNGNTVNAYYDAATNDLLGFGIPVQSENFPAGAIKNLQHKYRGCSIVTQMMFVDTDGYCTVYVSLARPGKASVVVALTAAGKAHYLCKM